MTGTERSHWTGIAAAILWASQALAGAPSVWQGATQAVLEKGEPELVSITPGGALVLSPMLDTLWSSPDPYIFSLAVARDGTLFIGTAGDGIVYRLAPGAKEATEFFQADGELHVTALALGPKGTLYAGSAPDGRIYRIEPDGKWEVFFDPECAYVWALALDPSGNLYAATGDEGEIWKITPAGEGSVWHDSSEINVTVLLPDGKGNFLAGGDGGATVFRLGPDGTPFVLWDSSLRQITSLALGPDGSVYASAVSAPARKPEEEKKGSEPAPTKDRTEVVRIQPSGVVETLWTSEEDTALSLAWFGERLLAGTGKTGRLYALDGVGGRELVGATQQGQVTCLLPLPSGDVFAATSNFGKVFSLHPEAAREGTYLSPAIDAKQTARWGTFRATVRENGGSVRFWTRSGNTEKADKTWSAWEPVAGSPPSVKSPAARAIQWKAVLQSGAKGSPEVRAVELSYLPQNLRPRIGPIDILAHGYVFDKELATKAMQDPSFRESVDTTDPGPGSRKPFRLWGWQTLAWKGEDDNGDPLVYRLSIRGEDEDAWRPLSRDPVKTTLYAWDSTSLPDGNYVVRVEGSDEPANPPETALTGSRDSATMRIDNTPPRIARIQARAGKDGFLVEARTDDALSPLEEAEYSIAGGEWVAVAPADGLADSREEEYSFRVPASPGPPRPLVFRVRDSEGNAGTGGLTLHAAD